MIKVVVFDLWETLASSRVKESYSKLLKKEFNIKKPLDKIRDIFEETFQTKYWETEYDAFKEICRNLVVAPTDKNIFRMIALRERKKGDIYLFKESIPLLKQLKKKNYKTGIISNTSMADYDRMKNKLKILKYIDYPVFSFQVGVVKPDPVIYLEIQNKAQVYNNEILMIGDNFEHDVAGPKKLGINAIHFNGDFSKLKEDLKKFNVFLD